MLNDGNATGSVGCNHEPRNGTSACSGGLTTGLEMGKADRVDPACGSGGAVDRVFLD